MWVVVEILVENEIRLEVGLFCLLWVGDWSIYSFFALLFSLLFFLPDSGFFSGNSLKETLGWGLCGILLSNSLLYLMNISYSFFLPFCVLFLFGVCVTVCVLGPRVFSTYWSHSFTSHTKSIDIFTLSCCVILYHLCFCIQCCMHFLWLRLVKLCVIVMYLIVCVCLWFVYAPTW